MKQTAVEWIAEKLEYINWMRNRDEISSGMADEWRKHYLEQAKAMEKEQIIRAHLMARCYDDANSYNEAEKYYNENYLQTHTPKHYRVWFPDTMEAIGGYWWNAVTDSCGRLYDPKHPNEERDTVQWYIDNGYKIEEVTND